MSSEVKEIRAEQMREVCPNARSNGQHQFVFDHWCCCDVTCEDNVHRTCEFCGTSQVNGKPEETEEYDFDEDSDEEKEEFKRKRRREEYEHSEVLSECEPGKGMY